MEIQLAADGPTTSCRDAAPVGEVPRERARGFAGKAVAPLLLRFSFSLFDRNVDFVRRGSARGHHRYRRRIVARLRVGVRRIRFIDRWRAIAEIPFVGRLAGTPLGLCAKDDGERRWAVVWVGVADYNAITFVVRFRYPGNGRRRGGGGRSRAA